MVMTEFKEVDRDHRRQYLKSGGDHCPFCGCNDIEGDSVEIEGGTAWQEVNCLACDRHWHDLYTLTGVEEVVRD